MKRVYLQPVAAALILIMALGFISCKKDSKNLIPPPPPHSSPCKLTDIESTVYAQYQHYWFVYNKDGNLDSVYFSEVPGPKNSYEARCKAEVSGYVWYSTKNSTADKPLPYDWLFAGDITDTSRFPGSLSDSYTDYVTYKQITGLGYVFRYNAQGRLVGYTQTSSRADDILGTMSVDYSDSGNVKTLQFGVWTGTASVETVETTGFDSHLTPYANLAGFVFRFPGTKWGGAEFTPYLFGMSDHNPLEWVSRDNDKKEQLREKLTYVYNDHGQPTTRSAVRTSPDGGLMSYTENFAYDCQ